MDEGRLVFDPVDRQRSAASGPTHRQVVVLTLSFWVIEILLAEFRSLVDHSEKIKLYTFLRIATAGLGCLECFMIHRLAQKTRASRLRWRGPLLLGVAAAAGILNLKIGDALQNLSTFQVSDYGLGWHIYNGTYWALVFMAWTAIYLALSYSAEAADHERRARGLERLTHEAQLRALRFQVDPHFLFNALNSVSALVLANRNVAAETMIRMLARFFRTTLATNPHQDIPLREEIMLQQTYLEIERVRFPDLTIEIDIHPAAMDVLIPVLLLQPLVENAVKFSVANREGPAQIGITAQAPVGGVAHIEVWDDGTGVDYHGSTGTGTGLGNVRDRLRARFGDRACLLPGARLPKGFRIELLLPVILQPDQVAAVAA